jgi:hypothetical protein
LRLLQWPLFGLSIILMGLWFPLSLLRRDERWFWADNFGLDSKRGDPNDNEDSMEEAWAALRAKPDAHQIKNILHEWTKESPKRAAKFLSFVILVLVIASIAT